MKKINFKKSSKLIFSLFAIFIIFYLGCSNSDNKEKNPKTILNESVKKYSLPGAVFAFAQKDESPKVYYSGFSDLENNTLMKADTLFRIGSITKTFTASAIMILYDNKKLDLEDNVDSILPGIVPNGENITIKHLLTMRSGLSDYHQSEEFQKEINQNPKQTWTLLELIEFVESENDPGLYFEYRNINYIILGKIIETISGKSRSSFIEENICKKLYLENTYVPSSYLLPSNAAKGYLVSEDGLEEAGSYYHPSWGGAAGDMISNGKDLVLWLKAFINGTLLKEETKNLMFEMKGAFIQNQIAGYGCGTISLNGAKGHGGDYAGIYTSAMFEYQGNYIAALVNGQKEQNGGNATDLFFDMTKKLFPPQKNTQWLEKEIKNTAELSKDYLEAAGMDIKVSLEDNTLISALAGISKADNTEIENVSDWTGTKITKDLYFRIASITKSVTASAILILRDKGLISLDDKIEKWLPESEVSTKNLVTIKELLNHTSGIPDFIKNMEFYNLNYSSELKDWTLEERISYGKPVKEPGGEYDYSNTGYIILSKIIEKASGRTYKNFIEENIFVPLNMVNSYIPEINEYSIKEPYARGYAFNFNLMKEIPQTMPQGGWLIDQSRSNWQGQGYGDIISNSSDLMVWLKALSNGDLISKDSFELMNEFVLTGTENIEYGLGIEKNNGYIGHDGDLPGYHTGAYTKSGCSIVVLINTDSGMGNAFLVVESIGNLIGL
jgi:D-alanyl-D-alanine carboxypeptidase